MCFGKPARSNFSIAIGKAASLAAVENANTNGSRSTFKSGNKFVFVKNEAMEITITKNKINAKYKQRTSFKSGNNMPRPNSPTV